MKKPPFPFLNEKQKIEQRLKRSYTERFDMLMKLIRIQRMLKNAKIIKP